MRKSMWSLAPSLYSAHRSVLAGSGICLQLLAHCTTVSSQRERHLLCRRIPPPARPGFHCPQCPDHPRCSHQEGGATSPEGASGAYPQQRTLLPLERHAQLLACRTSLTTPPRRLQALRGIEDALAATHAQCRWGVADLDRRIADPAAFAASHGLQTLKRYHLDHPYSAPGGSEPHLAAAGCPYCRQEVAGVPLGRRGIWELQDSDPVLLTCGHVAHVECARAAIAHAAQPAVNARAGAEALDPQLWPPRCGHAAEAQGGGAAGGASARCCRGFIPTELALKLVEAEKERKRIAAASRAAAAFGGPLVRCRAGPPCNLLLSTRLGSLSAPLGEGDPAALRPLALACPCGARTCSGRGGVSNCCGRPHGAVPCDAAAGLEQRLCATAFPAIGSSLALVSQLLAQEPANRASQAVADEKARLLEPLRSGGRSAVASLVVAKLSDQRTYVHGDNRSTPGGIYSEVRALMDAACADAAAGFGPAWDAPPGAALGPFDDGFAIFAAEYAASLLNGLESGGGSGGSGSSGGEGAKKWAGKGVPSAELLLRAAAPLVATVAQTARSRHARAAKLLEAHRKECERAARDASARATDCRGRVRAALTSRRAQQAAAEARACADACERIAEEDARSAALLARHRALAAHADWVLSQTRELCASPPGSKAASALARRVASDDASELFSGGDDEAEAATSSRERARLAWEEAEAAQREADEFVAPLSAEALAQAAEDAAGDDSALLAVAVRVRPCPRCLAPVEKRAACNAMRCAACRFDFCWSCLGCASLIPLLMAS